MTKSATGDPAISKEAKLSRRDWIILPALGLLTIAIMVISSETLARRFFGTSQTGLESCLVLNDAATGVRGIPNSVCLEKIPETQLVEYKFDCAGYRSGKPCGPKPPGTFRIALIGSSIAMGQRVPVEETIATLLPKELSKRVGRQVDLYNYAMAFGFPRNTALRFNEVLAGDPDLILWIVSSIDLKLTDFSHSEYTQNSATPQPGLVAGLKNAVKEGIGGNPFSASTKALGYYLQKYKGRSEYIRSYLAIPDGAEGDWDAGPSALRAELSPKWKERMDKFEGYAADIEKRARASGVPIVVTMVPTRAQVAMISMGDWPKGFDPYALDRKLDSVITSQGGTFLDILPGFRATSKPEQHFYPIDGHPDADGHAMIAELLAKELTGGAVPGLKAAAQSDGAFRQVR